MRVNKAILNWRHYCRILYLGNTLHFLSGGKADKTDVAIIFSLSATLLASWAVLVEGRHKKRAKKYVQRMRIR